MAGISSAYLQKARKGLERGQTLIAEIDLYLYWLAKNMLAVSREVRTEHPQLAKLESDYAVFWDNGISSNSIHYRLSEKTVAFWNSSRGGLSSSGQPGAKNLGAADLARLYEALPLILNNAIRFAPQLEEPLTKEILSFAILVK